MTAREVVQAEMGRPVSGTLPRLQLRPGLSDVGMGELESQLGVRLPSEARELLAFTSGFSFESFGDVSFLPKELFPLREMLPLGLPIATDEAGNDWVIDISAETGAWGPVVFMCHDPPVLAIQAPDLAQFLGQVFEQGRAQSSNRMSSVREATNRIWRDDPYLLDIESSRASPDPAVARFSKLLPQTFRVADLRRLEIGSGFAWGRNGPTTTVKRYGSELLFGVEARKKSSLVSRLLRRTGG